MYVKVGIPRHRRQSPRLVRTLRPYSLHVSRCAIAEGYGTAAHGPSGLFSCSIIESDPVSLSGRLGSYGGDAFTVTLLRVQEQECAVFLTCVLR